MLKRISLTLLFIVAIGSAWWLVSILQYEPLIATQGDKSRTGPNHYMEDFYAVTMNDQGTPRHKLSAPYMAHYPDEDKTVLKQPKFTFHQRSAEGEIDEKTWSVNADQGTILDKGNEVILEGNVKLADYIAGEGAAADVVTTINTDSLRILPNYDYAETRSPVHITRGKHVVNAVGIKLYFDREILELESKVRGTYVPNS